MGDEVTIQKLRLQIEELQAQLEEAKNLLEAQNSGVKKKNNSESDLKESNRRLNTLVNNLQGVVYRCKSDKNWTIEYISDGITELTGYLPEDFIENKKLSFNSIIHQEDQVHLWNNWQKILEKKQTFTAEYRIITSSGEVRWIWERGCGVFEGAKLIALEGFLTDITEKKIAEQEIYRRDKLIYLTGSMAKVGGWEFDVKTKEGTWSEEVARIHDLDPSSPTNVILGLSFYDLGNRAIIEKAIKNAIENGEPYDLELELTSAKGIKKWIRTQGTPIFEDNKVTKIQGIFQDITDRKQAIRKLEDEKIRLKSLIESIPDMIWLKDPEGVYIICNPRFEKFFGAKEAEIRGKTDYDFMPVELADFFREKDNEAIIANKPTTNFEWVTFVDDGHQEYLETIKTPMYDSQGNLVGVLGIARDTTEKYRNEELLKEKDLIFQSLLENSPIYIFFKDQEIRALHLSRNYEKMLGMPLENIIGKDMFDLFPSELAKSMVEDDKRILKEGKLVQVEEELNDKYYTTIKFPIVQNEKQSWLAGFTIDITEQKKAQKELLIAKEKAEESDKLKTAFLQNMSHEIRTPMNAIMGFSELLPDAFDDKKMLEQYSGIIIQRCDDLLTIIDEILDIAKIESGHLSIHNEDCMLKHWFSEMNLFFTEYQKHIKKEHIELKFNCAFLENDIVRFDQGKIKQILTNLIGNAFKFTEKGEIEIGCHFQNNNQLHFYVSDTGLGIPIEKQSFIFDRFAQIDTLTSRLYGGTGLGLAIAKGMIDAMKGNIYLKSSPGEGTTFYFWIPVEKNQELPKTDKTLKNKIIHDEEEEKRILIVEDDHFNYLYFKELFTGTKFKITHAQNGMEAINYALNEKFDLILMDIRLPDIDGYELTRNIKTQRPELKIIAQTAYAAENDRQKALKAGCDDYISKPIKYDDLIHKMNKLLQ